MSLSQVDIDEWLAIDNSMVSKKGDLVNRITTNPEEYYANL